MLFSKFDKVALVFFVVVVGVILASAAFTPGSSSRPWHTLQQVSVGDTSFVSVDADSDGNIDVANYATSANYAATAGKATNADKILCNGSYQDVNSCGFGAGGSGSTPGGGTTGSGSSCSLTKTGLIDVNSTLCNGGNCTFHSYVPPQQMNKICELLGNKSFASDYTISSADQQGYNWYTDSSNPATTWTSQLGPRVTKISCWKEDCSVSSASLPDCGPDQYLKRNSTDTNWICVDTVFNNQISSVPLGNFTKITGNITNVDCDISSSLVAKLSDGIYSNGVYCKDMSSTYTERTPASIRIDLNKFVHNGLVYVDVNLRKTDNGGADTIMTPFKAEIYSSVNGTSFNQIDNIGVGSTSATTSFAEFFLSGTFNGRYLQVTVYGQVDESPNGSGNFNGAKGEAYINEIEVYSFTD